MGKGPAPARGRVGGPLGPGCSLRGFFNGAGDGDSEAAQESEGSTVKAVHSELWTVKGQGSTHGFHGELSASTFGALERLFLVLGLGVDCLGHV